MIDDSNDIAVRKYQANLIMNMNKSYSFSKALNLILLEGLKNNE